MRPPFELLKEKSLFAQAVVFMLSPVSVQIVTLALSIDQGIQHSSFLLLPVSLPDFRERYTQISETKASEESVSAVISLLVKYSLVVGILHLLGFLAKPLDLDLPLLERFPNVFVQLPTRDGVFKVENVVEKLLLNREKQGLASSDNQSIECNS